MMKRAMWLLALCASGVLLAGTASGFALRGSVFGTGGTPTSGPSLKILGTAGQAAVGLSNGPTFILCHGFWCFGGTRTVSVEPPPPGSGIDLPTRLEFGAAVPNPASSDVSFALALPKAAEVRLVIFDVRGRQVAEPVRDRLDPGRYRLQWDAPGGVREHTGVYFARLLINGQVEGERRVVIVD